MKILAHLFLFCLFWALLIPVVAVPMAILKGAPFEVQLIGGAAGLIMLSAAYEIAGKFVSKVFRKEESAK